MSDKKEYISSDIIEMELKRRGKGICTLCAKYERCIDYNINRKGSHRYCWQPLKITTDAIKIVHCRDCKHLYCCSAVDRRFYCRNHIGLKGTLNIVEENPYCSYGELKEEKQQ